MNHEIKAILIDLKEITRDFFLLRKFDYDDDEVDIMYLGQKTSLDDFFLKKNAVKIHSKEYFPHVQYHVPIIKNNKIQYIIFDFLFDYKFGKNGYVYDINFYDKINIIENNDGIPEPTNKGKYTLLCIHEYLENKSQKNKKRQAELSLYKKETYSNIKLKVNSIDIMLVDICENNYCYTNFPIIVKYFFIKVYCFIKRLYFANKQKNIIFMGVDGVGKTFFMNKLCHDINTFDQNLKTRYNGEKNLLPDNVALKLINHIFYILKRWFSFNVKGVWGSGFVVSDRHIFDRYFPSPATSNLSYLRILILKILINISKKPSIIFFLSGKPAIISARKKEYTENETSKGQIRLRKTCDLLNISIIDVDTTQFNESLTYDNIRIYFYNFLRECKFNAYW